jgi:hypothetical protein
MVIMACWLQPDNKAQANLLLEKVACDKVHFTNLAHIHPIGIIIVKKKGLMCSS